MFQKKVIQANLVQMRKRAHHRELQLSNYPVFNFQLKSCFGSCAFGGFSSECQATRLLQRIFFIPLCIYFTSGVFQTLLYIETNV